LFPTLGSNTKGLEKNADGAYAIDLAPEAPKGEEANWLQTVAGESCMSLLRMFGPLEPWTNKTWRPGSIKLAK
jgi:hypothetical protein